MATINVAPPPQPDTALLSSTVSELLGLTAQQQEDTVAAQGSAYAAEGAGIENQLYTEAGNVAGQNATIAEMAGQIQQKQVLRQAMQTIGAQRAYVAGSGFRQAGTALAQFRNSIQQAQLAQQIVATQANEQQSGFTAQQYTAGLEAQGATVQQNADVALEGAQTAAAATAGTNAANETAALVQYEGASGASNNAEAQIITQVLNGSSLTSPATLTLPTAQQAQQQAIQQMATYEIGEGLSPSAVEAQEQQVPATTAQEQQTLDQNLEAVGVTPSTPSPLAEELQNQSNPGGFVTINGQTINTAQIALTTGGTSVNYVGGW